jgi:hypothetical protein
MEAMMAERHRNALLIVDPGACNPSGIAHAIIAACREARDEGVAADRDAAVRLMVTQLAWICRADSNTKEYSVLLAECRRRASSSDDEGLNPNGTG